jgi:hypothetical protein
VLYNKIAKTTCGNKSFFVSLGQNRYHCILGAFLGGFELLPFSGVSGNTSIVFSDYFNARSRKDQIRLSLSGIGFFENHSVSAKS